MIAAFNSAVEGLKGFFSRSFWFGAFLPVLLFAAAHLAISVAFSEKVGSFLHQTDSEAKQALLVNADKAPLAILFLVVLAFALTPLIPLFRGMLDGSLLFEPLHNLLRKHRLAKAHQARRELRGSLNKFGTLRGLSRVGDQKIRSAYDDSKARGPRSDEPLVAAAEEAIKKVAAAVERGMAPAPEVIETAFNAVVQALDRNNPENVPSTPISTRMRQAADGLTDLLDEAETEAGYHYDFLRRRQRTGPQDEGVQATMVGDARRATERYTRTVYDAEFDYLWPRLLLIVPKEDPVLDMITDARSQLDFAVLSFVLSITLLIWLPVLAFCGTSIWLFLVVGIGGPLLIRFFYILVFESQLGFGEVARAAIDQHRLSVLRMLRQSEPLTRSGERDAWARLRRAEEDARTCDLGYMPKAPEA